MEQNLHILEFLDLQIRGIKLTTFADDFCNIFGQNWIHRNLQEWTRKVWNFGGVVWPNVRGGEVSLGSE